LAALVGSCNITTDQKVGGSSPSKRTGPTPQNNGEGC
jgi:hypothetical protein